MYAKILITCDLKVKTGLHIGGSNAFSAIGAVDSPVIRDAFTGWPIVPGSSLKGKLRTLLARSKGQTIEDLPECNNDDEQITRLFGSSQPIRCAHLQFSDGFLSNYDEMMTIGLTEVKTENSVNRKTSVANPRQIERVNPGAKFEIKIVYELDDETKAEEDLALLAKGMKLLQLDYLGGHGSRGSGRVSFQNFKLSSDSPELEQNKVEEWETLFKQVEEYELFSV